MSLPADLKYTKDHEWIKLLPDDAALIGITDYAQASLGDITFVETPEVGDSFDAGSAFGVVESVKAASDLFMPVDGEVLEVNESLESAPETVNSDPYASGWIVKVRMTALEQVDGLLDSDAYAQYIKE